MTLPPLTLNQQFVRDFSDAKAPCCALGLVRAEDTTTGFIAVKPNGTVPRDVLARGIRFGHRLLITQDDAPVCQFVFTFYGFDQYSVLVNPSRRLAITAIETMIRQKDYFFFVLNPDGRVSAFRTEIGEENLAGMRDTLPRMQDTQTTDAFYSLALRAFERAPDPPDTKLLEWVCRDDPAYMDLDRDIVALPSLG